ncbi:unnamed protein product [Citrullus colocynthis]|uniref:Uncharacterized protein n=1 Tax=Citrullus colocynthis TaxID=252529 RepID=A0ABP0Y2M0_9ROSI
MSHQKAFKLIHTIQGTRLVTTSISIKNLTHKPFFALSFLGVSEVFANPPRFAHFPLRFCFLVWSKGLALKNPFETQILLTSSFLSALSYGLLSSFVILRLILMHSVK